LEYISQKTTTTISSNCSLPNNANADTYLKTELTMSYNDSNNPINRGEMTTFRIYRDSTDSADTMENGAILTLLTFEFATEVI
jgi:hypothetical protein